MDLKALLALIHHAFEQPDQLSDHLPAAEHEAHDQEPGEEPELLVGKRHVLRLPRRAAAVSKVLPAEDGLVEYVGLGEVGRVAGALVLAVVQLGDPRGDLAHLPPPQPGFHQLLAVLLLQLPQLGVDLERLVEIRVAAAKIAEGKRGLGWRSRVGEKRIGGRGVRTDCGRNWGDHEP